METCPKCGNGISYNETTLNVRRSGIYMTVMCNSCGYSEWECGNDPSPATPATREQRIIAASERYQEAKQKVQGLDVARREAEMAYDNMYKNLRLARQEETDAKQSLLAIVEGREVQR